MVTDVWVVACPADLRTPAAGYPRIVGDLKTARTMEKQNNAKLDELIESGVVKATCMDEVEAMRYRVYPGTATINTQDWEKA